VTVGAAERVSGEDGRDAAQNRYTIQDIAQLAGVSVGTVSNVLNRPELVTQRTRQRVVDVIDEVGFIRNGSARQLRAGTSRAVGAIVLDLANPFFTEVARGIEDRLTEDGYVLILCSSDESPEREASHLRVLLEQSVLGLLVTTADRSLDRLEAVRRRGRPVVLLDRTSPSGTMCSAAVDDVRGGELAVAHLLSRGHQRIGFINGPTSIRQCADRRKGARAAIRASGLRHVEVLLEVTSPTLNADGGEAALDTLLAADPRPTAIFCVNDVTALGVLRGLRQRGLSVPEDLALVGYDDVEFAGLLATPLTSVRQPKYQLGRAAADLLLAEASEGPDHRHHQLLFQPELVVRASSDRPRTHR
jgi:LacI family transcriptional regulator